MSTGFLKGAMLSLLITLTAFAGEIVVNDVNGNLATPVLTAIKLSRSERRAGMEGRLQVCETSANRSSVLSTPAQLFPIAEGSDAHICWIMQPGKGRRTFKLQKLRSAKAGDEITAKKNTATGQFEIADNNKPVLRYNYATVEPGDILNQVATNSRIYARARSDYIHPLFGLDGETLTKDWSVDHPHHRGIYWAWPEVDWRGNRGDLHALQHVFARPTGKCVPTSGPVFAQIEAENLWKWEDTNAIVHERAIIRAYRATGDERIIDLEFEFTALNEPVLLARRNTDKYGGLNLRFAKIDGQEIVAHTGSNSVPRMAWAELSGKFDGAQAASGILVFQHIANPDYPGDWVQFPNLNWLQPTFPASGTRFELKKDKPLVLRFRLCLHHGGRTTEETCAAHWRAYNSPAAPTFFPAFAGFKRPSSL